METTVDSYLWLLPTIKYKLEEADVCFYNECRAIRISGLGSSGVNFIKKLNGTLSKLDLMQDPVFPLVIPLLENESWLIYLKRKINEIIDRRVWLSRQLSYYAHLTQYYPDSIIDKLSAATVHVVGAGGVGCHVAYSLAAAGAGNIVISDRDFVEESNINRQFMYAKEDIGRDKAIVVAEKLRQRFEPVNVRGLVIDYDGQDCTDIELPASEMVILCGEVNAILDRPHLVKDKLLLIAGYIGSQGVVGPLISPRHGTPCLQCVMSHVNRDEARRTAMNEVSRDYAWNSSGSTINGVVGQMAAEAAIRALTDSITPGLCLNETLLIDMQTLTISHDPVPLQRCEHSI